MSGCLSVHRRYQSAYQTGAASTVRLGDYEYRRSYSSPGKPLKELDFNFYGGIYRNVYLIRTDKLYITDAVAANKKGGGGVTVHFEKVSGQEASGTIQAYIRNNYPIAKKIQGKSDADRSGEISYTYHLGEIILNPNKDTIITTDPDQ
ncbi:MAG: hypothetical protein U0T56_00070 [Ferruginibacter sp.]